MAADFEALVKQVFDVTFRPIDEIRRDLRITHGNIKLTVERLYTGKWLSPLDVSDGGGTTPHPARSPAPIDDSSSLSSAPEIKVDKGKGRMIATTAVPEKKRKSPIIILDLSDDELVPVAAPPKKKRKPSHVPGPSQSKISSAIMDDILAPPTPLPMKSHKPEPTKRVLNIVEDLLIPLSPLSPMHKWESSKKSAMRNVTSYDSDLDILGSVPRKYTSTDTPTRPEQSKTKTTKSVLDNRLSSPAPRPPSPPPRATLASKTKNMKIKTASSNIVTRSDDIKILDLSQEDHRAGDSMIDDMSRFMKDLTPPANNRHFTFDDDIDDILGIGGAHTEVGATKNAIKSAIYNFDSDDDVLLEVTGNKTKKKAPIVRDKSKGRAIDKRKPSEVTGSSLSASTLALIASLRPRSDSECSEDEENHSDKAAPNKQAKAKINPNLPSWDRSLFSPSRKRKKHQKRYPFSDDSDDFSDRINRRGRLSEKEKARRAVRRAVERAQKESEKQARKAAKDAAAAQKAKDAELASLNKLKKSKKDSAPEMIVDISSALHATGIGQQLSVFLTNWGCEINAPWQPALGLESLWKVVKWRRRVKAEYSAAAGMFLPLPSGGEEVRDERHILVHLTAKEFVDLAYPIDPAASIDLATHVHKLKRLVPAAVTKDEPVTVIYMIEGLPAYIRKAKTSANRAFRTRVISAISGPYSNAATPPPPRVDEDMLEDALLLLQVEHKCLIHQTTNAAESAEWISILTSDISTIPYKAARRTGVDTAFCTDVGQVKTGSDPQDTFAKVLQEIARVTPAVANGVVEKYGNVTELVEAIQVDGNEVLAGLPLLSTRSGAPSQRSVGTALSRRISSVMLGTDPTQVDM